MSCGTRLVATPGPAEAPADANPWLVEPNEVAGEAAADAEAAKDTADQGGPGTVNESLTNSDSTPVADSAASGGLAGESWLASDSTPVANTDEPGESGTTVATPEPVAVRDAPATPQPSELAEAAELGVPLASTGPVEPPPDGGVVAAPGDPHGFATAATRLGPTSLQAAFPALAVASISLNDPEHVRVVVQGVIGGFWGVALLTDERVLLVTSRLWTPDRITLPLEAGLTVRGWAEGPHASLTFDNGREVHEVGRITDTALAVEFADLLRAEIAELPPT